MGSVFHCNFFVNYISWEERVEERGSQTLRAVCASVGLMEEGGYTVAKLAHLHTSLLSVQTV